MVRFGIGFAKHDTIYHAAKYKVAWEAHKPEVIHQMHDQMMHTLAQPFGMFHWLCSLIGAEEVKLYVAEGHIKTPSIGVDVMEGKLAVETAGRVRLRAQTPPAASGSRLSRKRSHGGAADKTIEISDDEIISDDEDLGGATKKKRYAQR